MTCIEVKNMLSQYHDNDLNNAEKAAFERHLSACPDCKERVRKFSQLSNTLKGYKMATAPDDFLEQLHKRMEHEGLLLGKQAEPVREPEFAGMCYLENPMVKRPIRSVKTHKKKKKSTPKKLSKKKRSA